uniref:Uncharacterized protein n=1 Tax=Tetraselmis sp. GSL018 TaxID=582737 RepID=A0A061R145_9CHLO
MDSPPSKKASQQLKPWWSGRSGRFEPIFPDGPALALTRTHVALQEKSNELEFLDASYKRAQKAWNDEKSCLEEQIRNLRSEASRNEQNFRDVKDKKFQESQIFRLAEQGWASEKQSLQADFSDQISELKNKLDAATSAATTLETENRQLRRQLQELRSAAAFEDRGGAAAAEARAEEREALAAEEARAEREERIRLQSLCHELQARLHQVQAELSKEREIRSAHDHGALQNAARPSVKEETASKRRTRRPKSSKSASAKRRGGKSS